MKLWWIHSLNLTGRLVFLVPMVGYHRDVQESAMTNLGLYHVWLLNRIDIQETSFLV